jgi:hypothetical protein
MNRLMLMFIANLVMAADGRLSVTDARLLVENAPDFLNARSSNRCPRLEVLWLGELDIGVQMRSRCTKSPSGLIGNYIVDRQTAEVWIGVDRDHSVQSKRLRELQQDILKRIRVDSGRKK